MRNRILAIAAIAGAVSAPMAAPAQSDSVGIVRGGADAAEIAADQRPAFREYIIRERVPNYTIPDWWSSAACCREPASPLTSYRRPSPSRLSLHRGERPDRAGRPRTRRIVQVVE